MSATIRGRLVRWWQDGQMLSGSVVHPPPQPPAPALTPPAGGRDWTGPVHGGKVFGVSVVKEDGRGLIGV